MPFLEWPLPRPLEGPFGWHLGGMPVPSIARHSGGHLMGGALVIQFREGRPWREGGGLVAECDHMLPFREPFWVAFGWLFYQVICSTRKQSMRYINVYCRDICHYSGNTNVDLTVMWEVSDIQCDYFSDIVAFDINAHEMIFYSVMSQKLCEVTLFSDIKWLTTGLLHDERRCTFPSDIQ